ncbi:MAG: choice-of-anchor Q domain-containing protein [Thermomicrobiales bacterium]
MPRLPRRSSTGGTIEVTCSGTITLTDRKRINTDITINGNGGLTLDGNDATRIFITWANVGRLVLNDMTLQNASSDDGGAIRNEGTLETSNVLFSSNNATGNGGAIYNAATGTATIKNTSFSGNTSTEDGAGIYNIGTMTIENSDFVANNTATDDAGAIRNAGPLTITDSTFSNNTAGGAGGAINTNAQSNITIEGSTFSNNSATGNGGAINNNGTLTVSTSTFTSNSSGIYGGAIRNNGTLGLTSTTISGNSAVTAGGGLHGPATMAATIVANSTTGGNCAGAITSGGYNLTDDDSCNLAGTGDIENSENIDLGPLQDNGGPTETMMPLYSSDAINAAACSVASEFDQRDVERPDSGTVCDIGAVEADFAIGAINVTNPPPQEGTAVAVQALTINPDGGTLTYRFDCDNDSTYETAGTGSDDEGTDECTYDDEGPQTIGVQVCNDESPADCLTDTIVITVENVAPTIVNIITDGGVPPGSPITVTVNATDPGVNDILSYRFDCDNDSVYEVGPQLSDTTTCTLDPSQAYSTINVEVSDGDSGVTTDSVVVGQAQVLCASYYTGALSAPTANGCPAGSYELTLPSSSSQTVCINPYTGALIWSPQGTCGTAYRAHVVPDDGPINYCQSLWTGQLRYSWNGACWSNEAAGVIPGN